MQWFWYGQFSKVWRSTEVVFTFLFWIALWHSWQSQPDKTSLLLKGLLMPCGRHAEIACVFLLTSSVLRGFQPLASAAVAFNLYLDAKIGASMSSGLE